MAKTLPKLQIRSCTATEAVQKLITKHSLIITDEYNYHTMKKLGKTVCVRKPTVTKVNTILRNHQFDRIIAVGGCTALDVARACAGNAPLFVLPTILSSACLSTNFCILHHKSGFANRIGTTPKETIICLNTIASGPQSDIDQWSSSGIGDLLGRLGGTIEEHYTKNHQLKTLIPSKLLQQTSIPEKAISWIASDFNGFTKKNLRILAKFLHNISKSTITSRGKSLHAGSEHWLYYTLIQNEKLNKSVATHGRLVSIGTLIAVKIWSEVVHDASIFRSLFNAYTIIGLPTTWKELNAIGLTKGILLRNLITLQKEYPASLFAQYFLKKNFSILSRIYEK